MFRKELPFKLKQIGITMHRHCNVPLPLDNLKRVSYPPYNVLGHADLKMSRDYLIMDRRHAAFSTLLLVLPKPSFNL